MPYGSAKQNVCYFLIYKILEKKPMNILGNGWWIRTPVCNFEKRRTDDDEHCVKQSNLHYSDIPVLRFQYLCKLTRSRSG